ncbi:MAG: alpha/beta hydrolase, partial [Gemmatimonadota bacterium]
MRAIEPSATGLVTRNDSSVAYEDFGAGEQTLLFLPPWSIVHSRIWKAQVPYFARHYRVLTLDPVGNGASDRPHDPARYTEREFAADALAVMDATGTERAVVISLSLGGLRALTLAAEHPERVSALGFIAPSVPLTPGHPMRGQYSFDELLPTEEGWAKYNRHYWKKDYRGFLEFFFSQMFPEPHSTKQIDDCVGWGLETTPDVLIATKLAPFPSREQTLELCRRIRCPVLVLHGDQDAIVPHARGAALARQTGGRLVTLQGSGHGP